MESKVSILKTFISLLHRDIIVFKPYAINRLIDATVWTYATLYVSCYILPSFGFPPKFALFLSLGNIAAWCAFETGSCISIILGDLFGINALSYYISLPIPSWLIFVRIILIDAYKSLVATSIMLPIAKIILLDQIQLSSINYTTFIISYILCLLFFASLGVFIASLTPTMEHISSVKLRLLFPMWFLGCYQFSWHMMYSTTPILAYCNLLNPVTYITEGLRHSLPLEQILIPFWICSLMTIFFIIMCTTLSIYFFKKRIDCL